MSLLVLLALCFGVGFVAGMALMAREAERQRLVREQLEPPREVQRAINDEFVRLSRCTCPRPTAYRSACPVHRGEGSS